MPGAPAVSKTPDVIEFRAELPYTDTGKLLRRTLRNELADRAASSTRDPHRTETTAMPTDETKAVLDHHMAALDSDDLDDLMSDYTEDSVFISNLGGVIKGLEAIRGVFAMTSGGMAGFEAGVEHVDGEIGFVTWKADGIALGTDTFVVRDGKIAAQTVVLHFA